MEQQKVTINELVKRLTDEMLRIGYSKQTIYRNFIPNMMHVVHFYEATGTVYYSPASSAEYLSYNIERCKRGEITDHYVRQIRSTISKMDEFFTTGTLRIRSNKHGTTYIISAENERLIDQFIGWKNYGPNTRDDVRWVVRKYLFYLESRGFSSLADVSVDAVKDFILQTASDVKAASLHNILLYLKYFHMFLKENSISAPDCVELFSYKVYRETMVEFIEFIFSHFDSFKLLLHCADGTKYVDFTDWMVEKEVQDTLKMYDVLEEKGIKYKRLGLKELHMLNHAYYSCIFETVLHDYTKEEAIQTTHTLAEFITAGWRKVHGL